MTITVGVLSYNSSMYIVETLESIANQTYKDGIHLIISDDGSSDGTLEGIYPWINENEHFFLSIQVLSSKENKGTVFNANRILDRTNTEWLKLIAADDVLDENCLLEFDNYVSSANGDKALAAIFSNFIKFGGSVQEVMPDHRTRAIIANSNEPKSRSLFKLRINFGTVAPAGLINVGILRAIGGFQKEYDLLEDLPTWDKLLESGYHFGMLDKVTVYYRVHSGQTVGKKVNPRLGRDQARYIAYLTSRSDFLYRMAGYHRKYNLWTAQLYTDGRLSRLGSIFVRMLNPLNVFLRAENALKRKV